MSEKLQREWDARQDRIRAGFSMFRPTSRSEIMTFIETIEAEMKNKWPHPWDRDTSWWMKMRSAIAKSGDTKLLEAFDGH